MGNTESNTNYREKYGWWGPERLWSISAILFRSVSGNFSEKQVKCIFRLSKTKGIIHLCPLFSRELPKVSAGSVVGLFNDEKETVILDSFLENYLLSIGNIPETGEWLTVNYKKSELLNNGKWIPTTLIYGIKWSEGLTIDRFILNAQAYSKIDIFKITFTDESKDIIKNKDVNLD